MKRVIMNIYTNGLKQLKKLSQDKIIVKSKVNKPLDVMNLYIKVVPKKKPIITENELNYLDCMSQLHSHCYFK